MDIIAQQIPIEKERQTDGDFFYYYCVRPFWRLRLYSEFVFA